MDFEKIMIEVAIVLTYHIISYNRYLTLVLRGIVLINTNLDQPTYL